MNTRWPRDKRFEIAWRRCYDQILATEKEIAALRNKLILLDELEAESNDRNPTTDEMPSDAAGGDPQPRNLSEPRPENA